MIGDILIYNDKVGVSLNDSNTKLALSDGTTEYVDTNKTDLYMHACDVVQQFKEAIMQCK